MIYVIRAGNLNLYKVGTANDPQKRLEGMQTGCPFHLEVVAVVDGGPVEERRVHAALRDGHARGEWFEIARPPTAAVLGAWAASEPPPGFRLARGGKGPGLSPERRKQISEASDAARQAVIRRDALIRAARAKGATFREIAEAAALSAAGVQRIVERGD